MFLQIGKRYTPFSALHQFFPTLPLICAQVAAKCLIRNTRKCPFKIKKLCPAPQYWSITHRLIPLSWNPPQFSLDNTFNTFCKRKFIKNVHKLEDAIETWTIPYNVPGYTSQTLFWNINTAGCWLTWDHCSSLARGPLKAGGQVLASCPPWSGHTSSWRGWPPRRLPRHHHSRLPGFPSLLRI
jgi:hypothetical protein